MAAYQPASSGAASQAESQAASSVAAYQPASSGAASSTTTLLAESFGVASQATSFMAVTLEAAPSPKVGQSCLAGSVAPHL